jgi:hypothetical protein
MVEHKCDVCGASFSRKSNYLYHINKKYSCKTEYTKVDDKYQCNYCPTSVVRLDTIKNHLECCIEKVKVIKNKEMDELKSSHIEEITTIKSTLTTEIYELKNLIEDYKNIINQKISELQKVKHELKKTQDINYKLSSKKGNASKKKQIDNSTNNTTNNNNSNNTITNSNNTTTNLINIVNFGNENIAKLTNKDKKEILDNCLFSIVKCVEKVHFNDAIPEQQNSYITGLKSDYGYKYVDGKFIATDIDDLIDTIIENRKEDVREILENRKDIKVSKLTIAKIEDLLDKLDSNGRCDVEYIRKEIRLLLFNNRDKVIYNKLIKEIDII